ncbi:ImmA/IrrE family metallo-endopeptidase [Streptococcus uberis]|uniref:ImmA/IrrE family metallo-endopeptidase n=1 Tax=Streptococcus uberis TaxID=1349 RepID=UPI0012B50B66|nr:ImmA/IrrE family metallo-endopeptidase [Streptococcus uberis]MTC88049.1 ImmA/IrrE family metallo-endopeptidase [Streptococcus uberis]
MTKEKIKEILKEKNICICYFDGKDYHRSGFYIPSIKTIFLNNLLSEMEQERVILHEIGHLNHSIAKYKSSSIKCENEANRFMITQLLIDYIENNDISEFNLVQFAKENNLNTVCDEIMIQDELKKILSRQ